MCFREKKLSPSFLKDHSFILCENTWELLQLVYQLLLLASNFTNANHAMYYYKRYGAMYYLSAMVQNVNTLFKKHYGAICKPVYKTSAMCAYVFIINFF